MSCTCPKPAALTAIVAPSCPEKFDQILRVAFQRKQSSAPFTSSADIKTKASWTALTGASDDTKIIVSPILDSFVIPSSEAAEEGGQDNTTPFGIPVYLGENPVNPTGIFRNLDDTAINALRELSCESVNGASGPQLTIWLFTKDGKIITMGDPAGDAYGLDIFNFRLGTIGTEGYRADNKSPFGFWLPDDWDEDFAIATPDDFNPLTDL